MLDWCKIWNWKIVTLILLVFVDMDGDNISGDGADDGDDMDAK